jgi:D-alanyl-D-alanine carboxypeptidase/D-alanyl-D-alanine-endopeptidase (penicillin-binding protein 4)
MQYLIAIAALAWLGIAAPPKPAPLPAPVAQRLQVAGIPADRLSIAVLRARDGQLVMAHRERESMPPASTIKPLTLAVALDRLGPAWRGRTRLVTDSPQEGDSLPGDIALIGEANADFDDAVLARMLAGLRNTGVRDIRGDLLLDRTLFEPTRTDVGLPAFDEAPEFRYNAIPDALPVGMQLAGLELDSRNAFVSARLHPSLAGVRIESALEPVDAPCSRWDDAWQTPTSASSPEGQIVVTLRGKFPPGCTVSTRLRLMERDAYIERLFRAQWEALGGSWQGRAREGKAPVDARLLAEHASRPLSELAFDINKRSDNPVTRLVYLVLGAPRGAPAPTPAHATAGNPGAATTAARADAAVRAWMREHSIDDAGLVLDNGSGLSRSERIAALSLAQALRAGRESRWAPEFLATFPIVAVDGAMRRRLADSPAAARARIKTGSLRDVWAVAGFVDDAAGETHVVVAMIHQPGAKGTDARPILDLLIDTVARSGTTTEAGAPAR